MPTGNEFSVVMFGQQNQEYKQTDREMSPGQDFQIGGPNASTPPGNYPNVYDRQAGSEPAGPDNYPEGVYNHIPATGQAQDYVTSERESVSGEYGQSDGITMPVYPGTNMVPSPTPSKQFSSKMTGDPKTLLQEASAGVTNHADLMNAYGYNMPVATMGSHPWLRDELATPSQTEPGNAEPQINFKIPKRQSV